MDRSMVLIFSSPSNPAGPAISETEFRQVITDTDPTTSICFDEAYVEFIEQSKRFDALKILDETKKKLHSKREGNKAHKVAPKTMAMAVTENETGPNSQKLSGPPANHAGNLPGSGGLSLSQNLNTRQVAAKMATRMLEHF